MSDGEKDIHLCITRLSEYAHPKSEAQYYAIAAYRLATELQARADAAEAALRERDAEIQRLTRERDEAREELAIKTRYVEGWMQRDAESRRLLERVENAMAYISRHGHTNYYDWNADPKKLTAVEGEIFDAIRAHLAGGER